jgi:hypothetical protein
MAVALGETLDALKKSKGKFAARDVVNAARPTASPIHDLFEWNDAQAADKFREEQARGYIRSLVIVVEGRKGEVTMPVAVSFGSGDGYTSTEVVMSSAQLRARLIQQALDEAEAWRDRYRHLRELGSVFASIERAKAKLKKAS